MITFKPGDLVRLKPSENFKDAPIYKDRPIGLVITEQKWNEKASGARRPGLKNTYPELFMYHEVLVNGEILDVYIDHLEALEDDNI